MFGQPKSPASAILAALLLGGMPGAAGRGESRGRMEDPIDAFINHKGCNDPDCWHCSLAKFMKSKLENKDKTTVAMAELVRHMPKFFMSSDGAATFLCYKDSLFDLAIEFAESAGYRNQAELFRIYKSVSEKIGVYLQQLEERGENSMTKVKQEPEQTDEHEEGTDSQGAEGQHNPPPAAAGPAPKRERRRSETEVREDYVGNDHKG